MTAEQEQIEVLAPEQRERFTKAADVALRVRRNILLLAAHAIRHRKRPHGESCEECREAWPCAAVMRVAAPTLSAVADLPSVGLSADHDAQAPPAGRLCSQCGERDSAMVKVGTTDGWCTVCLDEAAWTEDREAQVRTEDREAQVRTEAYAAAENNAALSMGGRLLEAMAGEHVRASTDQGPDYCQTCSDAVREWQPWPCPVARAHEAGIEEGVDSTWHLKQLRAKWEAEATAAVAAQVEEALSPTDAPMGTLDTLAGFGAQFAAMRVRAALTPDAGAALRAREAKALRDAAERIRTEGGQAWGGDARWITNGQHVADLAAYWLNSDADALEARTD